MCAEVCEEVWEVILKNVNRKKFAMVQCRNQMKNTGEMTCIY